MRKLFLTGLSIVCICFMFSSCRKCKDPQHIERATLMTEYFGNYKPGAYWIYLNRDSTKRDSIWVDNFEIKKITDDINDCLTGDELFFDMHCQYLDTTGILGVKLGFNGNDILTNTIEMKNGNSNIYGSLYTKNEIDTFFNIGTSPVNVYRKENYNIWPKNQNYIYPKTTVWGRFIIAPNFGIIQYNPVNSTDTFSLIKFYFS